MNITELTPLERLIYEAGLANEELERSQSTLRAINEKIDEAVEVFKRDNFAAELDQKEHEFTMIKEANTRFQECKGEIRKIALARYEATGEKTPSPVVQVKVATKPDLVVDAGEAIAWAVEKKLPTLLSLNSTPYRDQLMLGTIPDQPGTLGVKVSTSFFSSKLETEYERISQLLIF